MKWLPPTLAILGCVAVQLLGMVIFVRGFLPIKQVAVGYASHHDAPPEPSFDVAGARNATIQPNQVFGRFAPAFGRLVLVLIDALRWDFALGDERRMPFTRRLIDAGDSLSFIAKAQPPTVTMPRVKALTSGTIPGFVDVILNVDSKALLEDNIVYQLRAAGNKMLFFGDDTWIRLFPDSFDESDGTTSFFVSDYTEVDNNVTRHLAPTLARADWDVLILHYLGLDHIGHIGGPASPLVAPKLKEMDSVISTIYTSMEGLDRELPSLLVLCGDHGMSEAGSHGGASPSETLTPLIMLSSKFKEIKGSAFPYDEVQQIDMAPSLAVILGLPIPQNSLGIVIPEVLNLLPIRQRLRALQINSDQLVKLMEQHFDPAEFEDITIEYQHVTQVHAAWLKEYATSSTSAAASDVASKVVDKYYGVLKMMQSKMSANITRYDVHAMICGIVLCSQVLVLIMIALIYTSGNPLPTTHISKTFYFGCSFLAILTTHVTICTSSGFDTSTMLCGGSSSSIMYLIAFVMAVAVAVYLQVSIFMFRKNIKIQVISFIRSLSILEKFLLLGSVVHTVSLMSSSFVEEEHQTWYFLTTTLLVGFCIQSIRDQKATDCRSIVLILLLFRLLRSWNQTGIKWADLPDIGDWFVRPENVATLSVVQSMSLLAVYLMLSGHQFSPINLLIVLCVYLYRHAVGNVLLPVSILSSYKGIVEARLVFVLLLVKIFYAIITCFLLNNLAIFKSKLKTRHKSAHVIESVGIRFIRIFYESFILFVTLLLRPHNTPVVAMTVFIQQGLATTLPKLPLRAWSWSLICVWMGQATFYHQGNSNSIASIDLSSGYVGLDSHDPGFVAVLLLVSTNFGPVSWMIILIENIMLNSHKMNSSALPQAFLSLMLFRALPLAVYTIVVTSQRYHLFIWSVFSPKLLYEAMHTFVLAIFIICGIAFYLLDHYTGIHDSSYTYSNENASPSKKGK